ncbi:MAG: HPr(Ser) kinase/phosphatase [Breznakia sp.]
MTNPKVKNIVEEFNLEIINGNVASLAREITIADTNRPGLDLAGFFDRTQSRRIVILGDKEMQYIKTMRDQDQQYRFDFITNDEAPMLILTRGYDCPRILLEIAKAKNFPILRSTSPTSRLIVRLVSYLDEKLASIDSLHGVLLSIYGKGVLIRGESGMGKSEIALDLVRRGHQLISDDLVDCHLVHNEIVGYPPKLLAGFIELRGIGIVNIEKIYGTNSTLPKKKIDFVVELQAWNFEAEYDRVGIEETKYEDVMGVSIPKVILPSRSGRSMATLIEGAVTNIVLKESGYDSGKDFEQRVLHHIKEQKED